jgi:hypothetical protein
MDAPSVLITITTTIATATATATAPIPATQLTPATHNSNAKACVN